MNPFGDSDWGIGDFTAGLGGHGGAQNVVPEFNAGTGHMMAQHLPPKGEPLSLARGAQPATSGESLDPIPVTMDTQNSEPSAAANADVIMDELIGVAQADIEKHQTMYVHYKNAREGHIAREWRLEESLQGDSRAISDPGLPTSCSLKIIKAPAAYAMPMVQKKPFKPPFKLRLECRYKGTLAFPVTVEVNPVPEAGFSKPGLFTTEAARVSEEVDKNSIPMTISSQNNSSGEKMMDSDNQQEEATLTEEFDFTNFRFVKSSRMSKRWLIFSFAIREDLVYCMYDLPSVIVSRRQDQFSKAYETLMGGPPPVKRSRALASSSSTGWTPAPARSAAESSSMMQMDSTHARNWVVSKYREYLPGVMRMLSEEDIYWLVRKAGLDPDVTSATLIREQSWNAFEEWYIKCLNTLKTVVDMWDQTDPEMISGLSVDREKAERVLDREAPGTFLVRLCSEPGCFAVSTRVNSLKKFNHLLLDRVDLQRRRLVLWIQAHDAAQVLINVNTLVKVPKESVLMTGFYNLSAFPISQSGYAPLPEASASVASPAISGSQGMMPQQAAPFPGVPQTPDSGPGWGDTDGINIMDIHAGQTQAVFGGNSQFQNNNQFQLSMDGNLFGPGTADGGDFPIPDAFSDANFGPIEDLMSGFPLMDMPGQAQGHMQQHQMQGTAQQQQLGHNPLMSQMPASTGGGWDFGDINLPTGFGTNDIL